MKRSILALIALSILTSGFASSASSMEFLFKDPEYSFQCLRAISQSVSGAADIGEVLTTAARIKEGDDESWYAEWLATAERLKKNGDASLAEGHKVSAREAYFRPRTTTAPRVFLHRDPKDPRKLSTWRKSRDCFLKGARFSTAPIRPVSTFRPRGRLFPATFASSTTRARNVRCSSSRRASTARRKRFTS